MARENSCLSRIAAGTAIGGALGGAVGKLFSPFIFSFFHSRKNPKSLFGGAF